MYQYAARIAGAAVQSSLDATLKSSAVCMKIAANSTAYTAMKTYYKSDMTSYIDSAFNDGLNLLNFRCKIKCYLLRNGKDCPGVTGGWNTYLSGSASEVTFNKYTYEDYYLVTRCSGGTAAKAMATTKNKIDLTGYSTIYAYARGIDNSYNESARFGVSTTSGFGSTEQNNINPYKAFNMTSSNPIAMHSLSISSVTTGNYVKLCSALWGGSNGNRSGLWKNVYIV